MSLPNSKVQSYAWDRFPLIPFKYNKQEISLIRRAKALQDGINAILSDFQNNMEEDSRNTILILKNAEYWRGRFSILEQSAFDQSERTIQSLEKAYLEAQQSVQKEIEAWYGRFAANNQISLLEARRLLNTRQLEELRWNVKQYIQVGEKTGLDPSWMKKLENASDKFHISRLEALQLQIQQQIELLNGNQVDSIDTLLRRVVGENYTHAAFEIQKGLGLGWDIAALDQRKLDTLLKKPWTTDGRTFRDRCWVNKRELVNAVQTHLVQGMLRGDSPERTIQAVKKQFGVSQYKARRLVHTETSYFNAQSTKEAYGDLGTKRIEILETLDSRTCPVCGALDGKVIPLSEYEPGVTVPPFHPSCRGTTCPHYDDLDGERAARNAKGKVYYVPQDMTYQEWKAAFVDGGDKGGLTPAKSDDIIKKSFESDELLVWHYEKHRKEFGDISQEEYLELANQLLQEPLSKDVEQLIRSDGSISKYKFSSNEFLAVTKDGIIKTYFRPIDGKEYWRYEHERN